LGREDGCKTLPTFTGLFLLVTAPLLAAEDQPGEVWKAFQPLVGDWIGLGSGTGEFSLAYGLA
jgi:hypothetical protein